LTDVLTQPEIGSIFVHFLSISRSITSGKWQTVNLLALRLQWFESTPAHTSPRTILQVFKPFKGQLGISSPVRDTNLFRTSKDRAN